MHVESPANNSQQCMDSITEDESKKEREKKVWPQSIQDKNSMKKVIFMEELAEECEWTKNKSLKRLFTKWLDVFLDQIEDNRVYFKVVWTCSFSRIMAALRIFSSKPNGIYPCMGHIATFLVGNIASVQKQDFTNVESQEISKYCKSVYPDLLFSRNLTYTDYRFLVHATNLSYASRRDDLGLTEISSSRDLIKLCYGQRNDTLPRFDFDSEQQYFEMKKKALDKTLLYIDDNLSKFPFEAVDHPANVGTDTENESDTDYTVHKYNAVHRDIVKQSMSILLMTCFEITMKCPFSKEFQDCSDLYCCKMPVRKCNSRTYGSIEELRRHAWSQRNDVYHDVLSQYLDFFAEPFTKCVWYPSKWLPDGKLENSKIPFISKEKYFDLKMSSISMTNEYCHGQRTTFPFGQLRKYKKWVMPTNQVFWLMKILAELVFEAALQCPLNKEYLDKHIHTAVRKKYFEDCYECECVQFGSLSELKNHCSESDCQYHQLLHKYFEFFYAQSETCVVATHRSGSSLDEVKDNSSTKK